jgi:Glycosyl transferase family 2
VTDTKHDDQAIDAAAATAFFNENGDRAGSLPPVAVVIAAFNEEGVVGSVVSALPDTLCGLDTAVIVVSDGSADGTVAEARAHGALVCDVPVNRGQGAALRLGYRLAREGGAAYIVTTDADGQYNPAEMDRVLAPVVAGDADFVTGSRKLGSQETKDPVRRLGTWVFAVTISALTGQRITDSSFGMRAMRAEVTGAVRLAQPQYQSSELLIAVLTHGFRVAEVPATIHKRKVGESKKGHNAIYGLKYAGVVLGTWWRERGRARSAGAGKAERKRRERQRRVPGSGSAASSRGARRPGERSDAAHTGEPFTRPADPVAANGSEGVTSPAGESGLNPGRSDAGSSDSSSETLDPRSLKST